MKYFKLNDYTYIAEFLPSEGAFVAAGGNGLAKIEDTPHNYFESREEWNELFAINCSFYNKDGSRNGADMQDGVWQVKPYDGSPFINMVYNKHTGKLYGTHSTDLKDYEGAEFVKGVCPLITDGRFDNGFQVAPGKNPRTSIGQMSDGTIVMFVTDGRNATSYEDQLTVKELYEIMLKLGCVNAFVLDSGGSSTLNVNGKMVNDNENRVTYDTIRFYSKEKLTMIEETKFKCIWPTQSRRITSPYGPRTIGDKFHDGIDIGAKVQGVEGDEVVAAHDGIIVMSYYSNSYGNCIIINDSKTNYSTVYGHLKLRNVQSGDEVKQGDLIGFMGTTGNSTGPHLHFEVRNKHYDSNYWHSHDGEFYSSYDPMDFIVDIPVEETEREYKPSLQWLVDNKDFNSIDWWQDLIDRKAMMSELSIDVFIDVLRKVSE